jgi:IclR family acetate operon transcriptional repressor
LRAQNRDGAAAPGPPAAEQPTPQLLERAIRVLSLFSPDKPEWATTEIGRASGLAVPTVHRILTALHRHEFVVRDETTKRFRLGPAILALGQAASASTDLHSASLPALEELAAQTGETALLTVLSEHRDRAVCLERVESSQPLRLSVQRGRDLPLHAGASQKALLAFMPDAEAEAILAGPLEKLCDATIDDPQRLREELRAVRERGWATSFEETNVGVWGLAMTLLDKRGRAVAAIGVAGPRERLPSEIDPWLEILEDAIARIAAAQALRPSYPPDRAHPVRPGLPEQQRSSRHDRSDA